MDSRIISEFKGEINGVIINDNNTYYSGKWILEQVESKFGEIYNNEFVLDLISTIERMNEKYEVFNYGDLESEFYNSIENAENFNDIKFKYYGNEWKIENLNENLKNGYYEKNIEKDKNTAPINKFVDSFNEYSNREFGNEYVTIEELTKHNIVGIAYTEGLGEYENYSIQIEYDLEKEVERITVWDEEISQTVENKYSIDEYAKILKDTDFDSLISQENTGINYDKLDEDKEKRNTKGWDNKHKEEKER